MTSLILAKFNETFLVLNIFIYLSYYEAIILSFWAINLPLCF